MYEIHAPGTLRWRLRLVVRPLMGREVGLAAWHRAAVLVSFYGEPLARSFKTQQDTTLFSQSLLEYIHGRSRSCSTNKARVRCRRGVCVRFGGVRSSRHRHLVIRSATLACPPDRLPCEPFGFVYTAHHHAVHRGCPAPALHPFRFHPGRLALRTTHPWRLSMLPAANPALSYRQLPLAACLTSAPI